MEEKHLQDKKNLNLKFFFFFLFLLRKKKNIVELRVIEAIATVQMMSVALIVLRRWFRKIGNRSPIRKRFPSNDVS